MKNTPPGGQKPRRGIVKQRIQAKGLRPDPDGNREQRRLAQKLGIAPRKEGK